MQYSICYNVPLNPRGVPLTLLGSVFYSASGPPLLPPGQQVDNEIILAQVSPVLVDGLLQPGKPRHKNLGELPSVKKLSHEIVIDKAVWMDR